VYTARVVASAHLVRAVVRLALLMRAVPLLQAVLTLAFGFAVYRRLWVGAAAGCLAIGWSGYLALRAWRDWPGGRVPVALCSCDVAVALAAMAMLGVAVPPGLLTTSFYWAAPMTQAVILLAGVSLPFWLGCGALLLIVVGYGAVVNAGAGAVALPVAAGTGAGMAAYLGLGTVIACYIRRLGGTLTWAGRQAEEREARLGVLRARAEEFGRLHDDAVQVLEWAAGGRLGSAETRAYASWAAGRLRAAIGQHEPAGGLVLTALATVADGFTPLGFHVEVAGDPSLSLEARACSVLAAATIEALNNACKHSGATAAAVRVSGAPGRVVVTVEDHGRGFRTDSVSRGFGLSNSIFRRLEDAGGGAELWSAPDAGTAIRMWLPC
jgi:hypothetical protein